jgi:hypothetical protein
VSNQVSNYLDLRCSVHGHGFVVIFANNNINITYIKNWDGTC